MDTKNFKSLLSLWQHPNNFGLSSGQVLVQVLFATSHEKFPFDDVGGIVKHLNATASLQRPFTDQIIVIKSAFDFCTNIK